MVKPLELELRTYDRERGRLEDEHRGKFVLIRGAKIAGIFDDFQAASEHAARRCERESYLIHCIGTEMMQIPSALLDGLSAIFAHAWGSQEQRGACPMHARAPHRPSSAESDQTKVLVINLGGASDQS